MADDAATAVARAPDPMPAISRVVGAFVRAGRADLLGAAGLPFPAYDIYSEYEDNARRGPVSVASPRLEPRRQHRLLDRLIGFPFGVGASPLTLNHRFISYYSRLGCNVLTYKTVRSCAHAPHEYPHWLFASAESNTPGVGGGVPASVLVGSDPPRDLRSFSTANSFGNPSPAPEEWQDDVARSLQSLHEAQMLIVSVMGTAERADSADELASDFVHTARLAQEAGAHAVELNLSCPNAVSSREVAPLALAPELVHSIVSRCRAAVEVPLVVKLPYMTRRDLCSAIRPILPMINGVAGIDSVVTQVVAPNGAAAFGGRTSAGVSGRAIRELAASFVEDLQWLRDEARGDFDILAMGGVMGPADAAALFAAGANAVQAVTGLAFNPNLPTEIAERLGHTASPVAERVHRLPTYAYDFFLCHASEDKTSGAEELHAALTARGHRVFFDKADLRVGDIHRRRIAEAIHHSRFAIVVLSTNFFGKRYPEWELDIMHGLEIVEGRSMILPVWHGVDALTVARRCPSLIGRIALSMSDGVDSVTHSLDRFASTSAPDAM